MMLIKKLGLMALATISTASLVTMAVATSSQLNLSKADTSYSCNDIVFSETVGNPNATTDITSLAKKKVTNLDCSMTEWNHAYYALNMTSTAIKIGGQNDSAIGSVKLTLNQGMTASKLIIYAAGWLNDTNIKLGVNGSYQDLPQTTGEYEFLPYIFELGEQLNEIVLSNNNTGTKSRVVISKIVLRLYNEALDEGSSTDTNVELITGTNASACTVNNKDGIKVGTSSKGGDMSIKVETGVTRLILYAAAWKGVTNLSLNITKETTNLGSITLTPDNGISNNSPFTLIGNEEDFKFEIDVNTTTETTFKFTSSIAKRFVIWNASVE